MTALANPERTVYAAIGKPMGEGPSHEIVLAAGRGIRNTWARARQAIAERYSDDCLFHITGPTGVPSDLQHQFIDCVVDLYRDELASKYETVIEYCDGQADFIDPDFNGRRYVVLDGSELDYTPRFAGETERHP